MKRFGLVLVLGLLGFGAAGCDLESVLTAEQIAAIQGAVNSAVSDAIGGLQTKIDDLLDLED